MLLYNIESIARKLNIDYELTDHIDHMGVRGSSREDVLKFYIKQLLPERFAVGNGVVTDVNGTQSKQQDFFVYDAFNSPVFLHTESSSIVPIESVYATIEVKSTLKKDTLIQSVNNIKSVKELTITVLKNSPIIPYTYNRVFGAVFSYTCDTKIETIAGNLHQICQTIPPKHRPSVVCILDQGVIVNVEKNGLHQISAIPSEQTTWGIVKNTSEMNLYLFYLLLQQHLNTSKNFPPDLLAYANKSHALDNMQVSIPKDLIPDDAQIDFGESGLTGEDLKFLADNQQLIYKLLTKTLTAEELSASGKTPAELELMVQQFAQLIKRTFSSSNDKIGHSETALHNSSLTEEA